MDCLVASCKVKAWMVEEVVVVGCLHHRIILLPVTGPLGHPKFLQNISTIRFHRCAQRRPFVKSHGTSIPRLQTVKLKPCRAAAPRVGGRHRACLLRCGIYKWLFLLQHLLNPLQHGRPCYAGYTFACEPITQNADFCYRRHRLHSNSCRRHPQPPIL